MLQDTEPYPTGIVGHHEVFSIYPAGVHIASVAYVDSQGAPGKGPAPVISADHLSLTVTIAGDLMTLSAAVISANGSVPNYWFYQGNDPNDNPLMGGATTNHLGACNMGIEGVVGT